MEFNEWNFVKMMNTIMQRLLSVKSSEVYGEDEVRKHDFNAEVWVYDIDSKFARNQAHSEVRGTNAENKSPQ